MTPHQGNTILLRSSQQLPQLYIPVTSYKVYNPAGQLYLQEPLLRCFRNFRDTRVPPGLSHWVWRSQNATQNN